MMKTVDQVRSGLASLSQGLNLSLWIIGWAGMRMFQVEPGTTFCLLSYCLFECKECFGGLSEGTILQYLEGSC